MGGGTYWTSPAPRFGSFRSGPPGPRARSMPRSKVPAAGWAGRGDRTARRFRSQAARTTASARHSFPRSCSGRCRCRIGIDESFAPPMRFVLPARTGESRLFDVVGRGAQVAVDGLGLGGPAHVADAENPASKLAQPAPDADVVILQQPFEVVAHVHTRQPKRGGRHR